MEDFSHECDKTLHLIPCPLCKYYVRFQAEACHSRRDQRKCYVCDICDHCKRAHDRQLQAFFNLRQKELKEQKQNEDPLRGDSLGLLREFFKSLVPNPRIPLESVDIEPVVPIRNSQGSQTEDELECDDLRLRSISEPYEHGDSKQHTKKPLSLRDTASTESKKINNDLAKKKTLSTRTSVKHNHGEKITEGDSSISKQGVSGGSSARNKLTHDDATGVEDKGKETPKSPRRGVKSSSKAKGSRKSAFGTDSIDEEEQDTTRKHFTSVTSMPSTLKLTLNVDNSRTRLDRSKIMLNIHNGGAAGVMSYALSNRKFIDNGITKLPTTKVMRKLYRYEMKPAEPELDWFARNKSKGPLDYDTGEPFARFKDAHYQLFYRNGDLALDHYYGCKENNVKYRTVTYDTDPCIPKSERTKKPVILATFDDMGNGIVYDSNGNVRLEYNQSEGVVYDKTLGTPARWRWHNLNEPPELKEVVVNTELPRQDAHLKKLMKKHETLTKQQKLKMVQKELEEKRIAAIEKDNLAKILRAKHKDYKQFELQMKALKMNDQFSLHINRQSAIFLRFQEGPVNLKFNVGLELQSSRYVDSEFVEVGNFMNPMERLPGQSDSLSSLQRVVLASRRSDSVRRCKASPEVKPAASVDRMNSVLSKPLRTPFTVASEECVVVEYPHVCCRCR